MGSSRKNGATVSHAPLVVFPLVLAAYFGTICTGSFLAGAAIGPSAGDPPMAYDEELVASFGDLENSMWRPEMGPRPRLSQSLRNFEPAKSSSFALVDADIQVQQTFVDGEAFRGFDVAERIKLGASIDEKTRLCCITKFIGDAFAKKKVQGILGLSFANFSHSPSILKTLSQRKRPTWHINNHKRYLDPFRVSIAAGARHGEIGFGGVDHRIIKGKMQYEYTKTKTDVDDKVVMGGFAIRLTRVHIGPKKQDRVSLPARVQYGARHRLDVHCTASTCVSSDPATHRIDAACL